MRSTSLSREGAERTRTHVRATAGSHVPLSETATLGGAEGFGGAMAGSVAGTDAGLACVGAAVGACVRTGSVCAVIPGAGVTLAVAVLGLRFSAVDSGTTALALSCSAGDRNAVLSAVVRAAPAPLSVPSARRDIRYPTAITATIPRAAMKRPRRRRAPAGAVEVMQFGQTPIATGRCTPQVGQFTVGTRSPERSYETKGAWQRGQRVAPTSALAPHALQLVYGIRVTWSLARHPRSTASLQSRRLERRDVLCSRA